jgi:hypothetical protein
MRRVGRILPGDGLLCQHLIGQRHAEAVCWASIRATGPWSSTFPLARSVTTTEAPAARVPSLGESEIVVVPWSEATAETEEDQEMVAATAIVSVK